jgi:uroporphyrinogen decarboxylase
MRNDALNSKLRVHSALERQPVDRVPVFMWFHPDTARNLGQVLEIAPAQVDVAMGNDVRQTWVNNNYAMEGITHEREGQSHTDVWGIHWVKKGAFNQIVASPLEEATPEQMRAYRFPFGHSDELLAQMDRVVRDAGDCFLGCDVSPCVFEMYWRLRGMEPALMDMAAEPELAAEMMGRCADFAVHLSQEACCRFPLDWLWTGDDVASQQALIMSPRTWREMIKPHLKRVCQVGKQHELPVAYHSCGAIRPIIGDLIEIGVDVLNPIQCNCEGMDPLDLKREFGARLAFMGGVDTQGVLPNGSVGEVRAATRRLIDGMAVDGGGYILAASHTIPPETPMENIFAMYAEAGISREEIFDRAATLRRSRHRG